MMNTWLTLILLLMCSLVLAQKKVTSGKQIWAAYSSQFRLSDHWGLWGDVHLRTKEDFTTDLSQSITRLGPLAAGNAYRSNHVFRVFCFQNFDLRKKTANN